MQFSDKQIVIMEAAEQLFAEQGFNGTSVRDIAEKAQVNLAMISYYFGSKDKLLEALFAYRGEIIKIKLETIIQKEGLTALDKIYLLIDHYIDKIWSQQCFSRVMAREQILNTGGPIAKLILDMKKRNQELISKLIHEGQKNGEFSKHIDIPLLMATMIGTVNTAVTTKHIYRELNNLQSLSDEALEKTLRKKLTNHLRILFKAILTHEA